MHRYHLYLFNAGFAITLLLCSGPVLAQSRTYTTNEDFGEGTFVNVSFHNDNELEANLYAVGFPFIAMGVPAFDAIIRINSETGQIVGTYLTAPANSSYGSGPMNAIVDLAGNMVVANGSRLEYSDGKWHGSIARIGTVMGGTEQSPGSKGYLKPPFDYVTCIDKNGDGVIHTSRGLRPLGSTFGEDECELDYALVNVWPAKTVSVDRNNDIWVGGEDHSFEKVSGATFQAVPGSRFNLGCGGSYSLIDANGILWSTNSGSVLRFDTRTMTGKCLDTSPLNQASGGIGVDPVTGNIWLIVGGEQVHLVEVDPVTGNPTGEVLPLDGYAGAVVIDGSRHIWAFMGRLGIHKNLAKVWHYAPDPSNPLHYLLVGTIYEPNIYNQKIGPGNGIAVGNYGSIWTSSNPAVKIEPWAGETGGGGYHVGNIETSFNIENDLSCCGEPQNASDMTGRIALGVTARQGIWRVVHDGGKQSIRWKAISWTGITPDGSDITVRARTADTEIGLTRHVLTQVTNGGDLGNMVGRFIEVQAVLSRGGSPAASAVLQDLTITAIPVADTTPPTCAAVAYRRNAQGKITEVNTSTSDPESGIASIQFQKLSNMKGYLAEGLGPFVQGNTQTFAASEWPSVLIRGMRIQQGVAASIQVLVTNGAGLTAVCDPVFENVTAELPLAFALEQNYPNPVRGSTTITYRLPEDATVSLKVYDLMGREVATLARGERSAGTYEVTWDGVDQSGTRLPSGVYVYRIEAGDFKQVRRLTLLR